MDRVYGAKKVLITGGASFIGSHLAEWLVEAGASVSVADDLSSGRLENLKAVSGAFEFHKGDLRDPSFASHCAEGKEIVFHLAARHGGRGYIDTHPVDVLSNLALDHTVFSAAAQAGARKIVYASSACVYPTYLQDSAEDRRLLKEEDANFREPGKAFADGEYGWAKLMGELQLRAFAREYGLSGIACRIFTSYGERENATHAVIALILKALARMDPYPIWGTGLQTRNYTHVQDTVRGLALCGSRLEATEVVNIGGSTHYSVFELLEVIFRALDWRPREIQAEPGRPVGVQSRASDNSRCKALLGWVPEVGLAEGVARTVSWCKEVQGSADAGTLEVRLHERDARL